MKIFSGSLSTMRSIRQIFFVAAVLLMSAGAAQAQYYLGVIRGEAKKIPIAVLDIHDETGSSKLRAMALKVLQADLRRSHIFDVMDASKLDLKVTGNMEPAEEMIKRAGTFGITGVVWAKIKQKNKHIVLEGKVYDAASGMRIVNKDFFGNKETFRRMVHAFADEIVARYTGEKGIASTRIAFVSDKTRFKELYVMDYDGQNVMKVSADRSICLSPAWSPDGKILAYVSYRDRNPDLYGLNMGSGKRWKIAGQRGLNISPAWSPNGKRLALAMSKAGGTGIFSMSKTGKYIKRLTYGTSDNVSPSWSPNGREIVFTSDRAGSPQLYIMGVDGTDVRRISYEGSYNASPKWSPRGDRIVYVSQARGLFKIATVNPDGSDARIITSGRGNDENPSWSPSGRQIVFSSNRGGKSNIYIMNADGSDIERITPNDANYTSPAWSP
jgi:TolB protein